MTPFFSKSDVYMRVELLPTSLRRKARKKPILFTGTQSFLEHMVDLKTMDPGKGEAFEQMFYEYFRHFYEQMERIPKGYERGLAIMQTIDLIVSKTDENMPAGTKVSCKKGCSACCHMRVGVADSEAEVMVSHIKRLGLKLDRKRLLAQKDRFVEDYHTIGWEQQKCGLLADDGSCSLYQWRPSSCRKYAVVSPPEMCDPRRYKNAWIVQDVHAEAFVAALLALEEPDHRNDRNLANQLLRRIPEQSDVWRKDDTEKTARHHDRPLPRIVEKACHGRGADCNSGDIGV